MSTSSSFIMKDRRDMPYELKGVSKISGLINLEFLYSKKLDMRLYLCYDMHNLSNECNGPRSIDIISWIKSVVFSSGEAFDIFYESSVQREKNNEQDLNETRELEILNTQTDEKGEFPISKIQPLVSFRTFATKESFPYSNDKLHHNANSRFHATDFRSTHVRGKTAKQYFNNNTHVFDISEYKKSIQKILDKNISSIIIRSDIEYNQLRNVIKLLIANYPVTKFKKERLKNKLNLTKINSSTGLVPLKTLLLGDDLNNYYVYFESSNRGKYSDQEKVKFIDKVLYNIHLHFEAILVDIPTIYSIFGNYSKNKSPSLVKNGILYFGAGHLENISYGLREMGFKRIFIADPSERKKGKSLSQCLTINYPTENYINRKQYEWARLFKNLHAQRSLQSMSYKYILEEHRSSSKSKNSVISYVTHNVVKYIIVYSIKCHETNINNSPNESALKNILTAFKKVDADVNLDIAINMFLGYIEYFQSLDAGKIFATQFRELIYNWKRLCILLGRIPIHKNVGKFNEYELKMRIDADRYTNKLISISYLLIHVFENILKNKSEFESIIVFWKRFIVELIDMAYFNSIPRKDENLLNKLLLDFTKILTTKHRRTTLKYSIIDINPLKKEEGNNTNSSSSSSSNVINSLDDKDLDKLSGDQLIALLKSEITIVHGFVEEK